MNVRNQLLGMMAQNPLFVRVRPNGLEDTPQYQLEIDQEKASALGVSLADINASLGTAWAAPTSMIHRQGPREKGVRAGRRPGADAARGYGPLVRERQRGRPRRRGRLGKGEFLQSCSLSCSSSSSIFGGGWPKGTEDSTSKMGIPLGGVRQPVTDDHEDEDDWSKDGMIRLAPDRT
jgi:hypothetical protein